MHSSLFLGSPRPLLASLLVVQLSLPAALTAQMQQEPAMQSPTMQSATPSATGPRLTGDEKFLQVLNRFAYGPRPETSSELRSMGLNAWFQQQTIPPSL